MLSEVHAIQQVVKASLDSTRGDAVPDDVILHGAFARCAPDHFPAGLSEDVDLPPADGMGIVSGTHSCGGYGEGRVMVVALGELLKGR